MFARTLTSTCELILVLNFFELIKFSLKLAQMNHHQLVIKKSLNINIKIITLNLISLCH